MKKPLTLSAVLFFLIIKSASPIGAQNVSFTLEPLTSFEFGYLGEHLYVTDTTKEHPMTSYLNWQLNPLWMIGIKAGVDIHNVFAQVKFRAGAPLALGQMKDYDWFQNTDVLQSLSVSEEILTEAYLTDITAGYRFWLSGKTYIMPYIGFSYHFINITAPQGGYGSCDPNPDDETITPYDDPASKKFNPARIDYWRESIYTWAGLCVYADVSKRISFSFALAFSPFVNITSVDHHYNNGGNFFTDMMHGFLCAVKPDLCLFFKLNKNFSLFSEFGAIISSTVTGDTYTSKTEGYIGNREEYNYAGASVLTADISLGAKIKF